MIATKEQRINGKSSRYHFVSIDNKGCAMINDLLRSMFELQLYYYVVAENEKGTKQADAILAFLLHYDIEVDEYDFQSAKKAIQRFKKTFAMPINIILNEIVAL